MIKVTALLEFATFCNSDIKRAAMNVLRGILYKHSLQQSNIFIFIVTSVALRTTRPIILLKLPSHFISKIIQYAVKLFLLF